MNQEWKIRSRGSSCCQCERNYNDNETFCSCLKFGEDGYARYDYCEACWDEHTPEDALSMWKTVFKLPPKPADNQPLKKENAESLLREAMETEDHAQRNVIYILAVMLERKRVLVERDVQISKEGLKTRVYEHKKTGETFFVPDPELRLDELEHVQAEVMTLLGLQPDDDKPDQKEVAEASAQPADTDS